MLIGGFVAETTAGGTKFEFTITNVRNPFRVDRDSANIKFILANADGRALDAGYFVIDDDITTPA